MLKNEILEVPVSEDWLEYDATTEPVKIKNITTVPIEYVFSDTSNSSHILSDRDPILEFINQKIFFRTVYARNEAKLAITVGITEKVAIANLSSGIGSESAIKLDAWGIQKFSQDYRIWRDTFYSGVSQKVWNISNANGYTKPVQGSGLFSSGDQPNNFLTCYSRKHSRYQPNSGILISTAGAFPNPTALGGIRRWGAATIEDGYFFEISEDGICYTVVRQSDFENYTAAAGQDTFGFPYDILTSSTVYVRVKYANNVLWEDITSDIATIDIATNQVVMTTSLSANDEICIVSVNDLKNEITQNLTDEGIDLSKQVLFDIQAQWRGAGDVTFTVRSASLSKIPTGVAITYNNLGQNERANISNPALSAFVECKNISSSGTEFQMKLGCINIAAEGGQDDVSEYESIVSENSPTITTGDTGDDETFLMIGHVPLYFKGRWNTRDAEVVRAGAWSDNKSHMNIYITNNLLFLTGGLLLKEKNQDTCILYDNNLTIDNTAARNDEIDLTSVRAITRARVQIDNTQKIEKPCDGIEYVITGGEYIIVTGQRELTAGSALMGASIEIGERT